MAAPTPARPFLRFGWLDALAVLALAGSSGVDVHHTRHLAGNFNRAIEHARIDDGCA